MKTPHIGNMSYAPQQDWTAYQALTKVLDRDSARSLSVEQRFALYEDLYRLVCHRWVPPAERDRTEHRRWAEKMARRRRLITIYQTVDHRRRG